jgi:hypothetical protein
MRGKQKGAAQGKPGESQGTHNRELRQLHCVTVGSNSKLLELTSGTGEATGVASLAFFDSPIQRFLKPSRFDSEVGRYPCRWRTALT